MKKFFLFILLALIFLRGSAQFYGGTGDGFARLTISAVTLNTQTGYCSGGNGDGFGILLINGISGNVPLLYCSGGSADGFARSAMTTGSINTQSLYCSGGIADGFARSAMTTGSINTQSPYCSGGNADGFGDGSYSGIQFSPSSFCSGGDADGFSDSRLTSQTLNSQVTYCSGGNGDGFNMTSFSGTFSSAAVYCSGGNGDGFSGNLTHTSVNSQPLYCAGGNADGFSFGSGNSIPLGTGLWTGLESTAWTTAGNWKNNSIPDATINVTIPAGCPNYPVLAGTLTINNTGGAYNAKRLDITDGASLTNTGALYAYGVVNISGSFIASNASSNTQRIFSGGEIIVNSTGNARFGNQSSGTGYCDVLVNSGGSLEVYDGTVDIDDQLNIMSGGNLTMTGGLLFIHKFGYGSAYSSSYPGSFYVASGATGSVSGGTVKVAGKASVGSYTSVNINSSSFSFMGTAALVFTDGVTITSDDVDLKTVAGCPLEGLTIDKPDRIVSIISDAVINGNVTIGQGSRLKISPGSVITVNGDISIQQ